MKEALRYNSAQSRGTMTTNMKTWCCIDQGPSSITVYFEKNVYTVGEVACMYAEIDNSKCKLNIREVTGELQNKLIVRANDGQSKTIRRVNCRVNCPGVGAGEKAEGDTLKRLNLQLGG
jgi:hypothetical protein